MALGKFTERYKAAKSQSIPRLCSFLYDLKRELDPSVRIKSDAMIYFQVESIKQRKIEGGGTKRRHSVTVGANDENDPQNIPKRKVRKIGKKEHNLGKNILSNSLN